ncbi:hypothetical protein BOTBODRAFT_113646 [Botryobasidium botryosum FD-172 SS1]|uniref:Actin-like ATPase domain-containing protein n=1 Tax=Botryobasidium botryosum (strain FD-172 SS1) TaxID=930990 RepID=A0A067MJF1_BOTB1|nr:hypothetical protein BOTBODRAFT_113646 [Botryobasidium botryosum FD-172 SS1]
MRPYSPQAAYALSPSPIAVGNPANVHQDFPNGAAQPNASPTFSGQSHRRSSSVAASGPAKLSISIDFGTTFSGVAYGHARLTAGQIHQIITWPDTDETFRKIPTCLLYDKDGRLIAWGVAAERAQHLYDSGEVYFCKWFKLFLEPKALRDQVVDPRLPKLPPGKTAIDLIIDFLTQLWQYARSQITREIGAVADLDQADVWLTVPAAWDAQGCAIMRQAAIEAGLVQSAHAQDRKWRDRLRMISEPEAAAVHCARLTDLHQLQPRQTFMICDAGGGTVDIATYRVIGQLNALEIAEVCARSGANCGSLFLDLLFRDLIGTLLANHPTHLDPPSLANFMANFSETDKLAYKGRSDDATMFYFTCFNVDDPNDPSVGLINGELAIPGVLLRTQVFDPIVDQVIALLQAQINRINQPIDALLLVGGFSGSEYLRERVNEEFASSIPIIATPFDADTATCRGAAQYGLARRQLVSSVVAPKAYMIKVKLPAEAEDLMKRPQYISQNRSGITICENRLNYIVQKGAILRKGQRVQIQLRKYSENVQDSTFQAFLYTSDSEVVLRYTDEPEARELCRWSVDLSTLPTFLTHANDMAGFYTEFELALEVDNAEVRGILLYNGQDWGHVVFDEFS